MAGNATSETSSERSTSATGWRVLKFGGTSVSCRRRWDAIESITHGALGDGCSVVIVCSAVGGVTDLLTQLVEAARRAEPVQPLLDAIRDRHVALGLELGIAAHELVAPQLERLAELCAEPEIDARVEAEILGHGELMSSKLGAAHLSARQLRCAWVDARDLLVSEPSSVERQERYLSASCSHAPDEAVRQQLEATGCPVVITQGFIARSPDGETVLLGRGGSDTSAAYIACLLAAERLEIWTDVPGLFSANPRMLPNARLLERVGYREAQALGALGAKVLHPRAIEAVWEHGIPTQIGWTEHPEIQGTRMNASRAGRGIKAITSRRGLAMFALRRPPSWQPVGFLTDVAACFSSRGLSMDLVSSSCSEIRVTVDLSAFPSAEAELPAIMKDLERHCLPRLVRPVASVSVVGERVGQSLLGSDSAYGLFADEALLMVVHAANEHHVSFVLDEHAATHLVSNAHRLLIESSEVDFEMGPTWAELTGGIAVSSGEAA